MNQFYTVSEKIKDLLYTDVNINTVTFGDLAEVDLAKQNIYPLAHITPASPIVSDKIVTLPFFIVLADQVDFSKEGLRDQADPFKGVDNLQNVYNDMLQVANRLINSFKRGTASRELFQITGDVTLEPFKGYENTLAGYSFEISIIVPNVEICV